MWLKKLKHRKLQFILAGIILFVSSLIFAAGLVFMAEVSSLGETIYNEEGDPNLFYLGNNENMADIIREAIPEEPLEVLSGVQLNEHVEHNGTKINGKLLVCPLEDYTAVPWEIVPKEGDVTSAGPNKGEIWLPRVWADLKEIHVGDTLILQGGHPFHVRVLFNTYIQPSAQMGINYFFINPADMSLLPELPVSVTAALSVRGDMDEVKARLTSVLGETPGLISFDKNGLVLSLTATGLMTGGMAMLSAVLVFVVAVVVIRFMLRSGIIKEYRSIGIYKSQGFSNRRIQGFYLTCYAAVGAVSLLIGALASLPAYRIMMGMVTKYTSERSAGSSAFLLALLAVLLLYAVLILNVLLATRSIRKITPVDALRIGVTSTKEKFTRSIVPNASSPLSMAVNDIGKYKGYSALITLILSVSFYLVLFSLVGALAVGKLDKETDIWFGVPKAEIYVSGALDDTITQRLRIHPDVSAVVLSEGLLNTSVSPDERYNYSGEFAALCFDDFSTLPYAEGRGPNASNEIAVNVQLLDTLGLRVGEYMSVTINAHKVTLLIVGAYQSMMNGGETAQLHAKSLPDYGLEFVPAIMFVQLRDGANPQTLIDEFSDEYSGVLISETFDALADSAKGVKDIVLPITLVLIAVFTIFSLLNIANLLLQNHSDNRRSYGILKALGFSGAYIIKRGAWKIFLLSVTAAAASIILHVLLSRKIFAAMVIDAITLEMPAMILALCGLLILVMSATLLLSLSTRSITPKDLMEE